MKTNSASVFSIYHRKNLAFAGQENPESSEEVYPYFQALTQAISRHA
ncbi:hypothetical protein ACOTFF_26185 [Achromobacter xylosoxidans]